MSAISTTFTPTIDLDSLDQAEVDTLADELEALLRLYTPVNTGQAQAGWYVTLIDNTFHIANPVEYISYLDEGTDRIPGYDIVNNAITSFESTLYSLEPVEDNSTLNEILEDIIRI